MEKNLGILCILLRPGPFRKGPWIVFLQVTPDGISKELSLNKSQDKSKWKTNPGRANGKEELAKAFNAYLDFILA
jgi:hypothetical protein